MRKIGTVGPTVECKERDTISKHNTLIIHIKQAEFEAGMIGGKSISVTPSSDVVNSSFNVV